MKGSFTCRGQSLEDDATKESIDDIMKHHHVAQEKVAEEMIKMAQNMKHTSITASNIIKSDKEVCFIHPYLFDEIMKAIFSFTRSRSTQTLMKGSLLATHGKLFILLPQKSRSSDLYALFIRYIGYSGIQCSIIMTFCTFPAQLKLGMCHDIQ